MRLLIILIVILVCLLLIVWPNPTRAADVCPSVTTAWTAQLDILGSGGSGGVHYLIDPLTQGLPSAVGNVAKLQYASNPNRWLINGVKVAPTWTYKYHITYWRSDWTSAGETWFATHPANTSVYFYFTMPVGEADHPRCGYGSVSKATVDELMKPRK